MVLSLGRWETEAQCNYRIRHTCIQQFFLNACYMAHYLEEVKNGKVNLPPLPLPLTRLWTLREHRPWLISPQELTWNLTHIHCQLSEWKRLIGQDHLVGIRAILHSTSFLSERERLLHHVGMMVSIKAGLPFVCMVFPALLKSLGTELGGQSPVYNSRGSLVIQTVSWPMNEDGLWDTQASPLSDEDRCQGGSPGQAVSQAKHCQAERGLRGEWHDHTSYCLIQGSFENQRVAINNCTGTTAINLDHPRQIAVNSYPILGSDRETSQIKDST